MKKFSVILVIASMVVFDLYLSGVNVIAGLLIIGAIGATCALLDYSGKRSKHTSITQAARQSRQQITSKHESSCERQSWDGWQRCSQELQYAK